MSEDAHPHVAPTRAMRLSAMFDGARDIVLYEFRPTDGGAVSHFSAGAHVDLHLPNGMLRQYSLANDPRETHRYLLGIKNDPASRGGSRYIHEQLRPGMVLQVGQPRNNFPLDESAAHSVFIAGGIGITPIRCMLHRAEALGLSWELHYAVRDREDLAFAEEIASDPRVHTHVDAEHDGTPLNMRSIADGLREDAHAYCCGPGPMIEAFERSFDALPPGRRHVEHFSAPKVAPEPGGAFRIVLVRSARTLDVGADQTILEVVREAGIDAEASCEQGICGSCEVRVISGEPDHRDILLSPEERAGAKCMMICCSRSKSAELVLDL
jgi:ferredoxin-NADP reductase